MTIFNQFSSSSRLENKLVYSQFMDQVKSGNIEKVRIDGQNITGTTNNGKKILNFRPYRSLACFRFIKKRCGG